MVLIKAVKGVGVSELVASLMTLLITISLGSLVLYLINEYINNAQVMLKSRLEELKIASLKSLDVVIATGNESSNEVLLVVASGKLEVKILAIYVNEVLVEGSTYTIKPLEITVLQVKSPVTLRHGESFVVKVVYEGGEEVIHGFTYR